VGDVDKGFCRVKGVASVDRATGAAMALGLADTGVVLRRAKVGWGLRTSEFVGVVLAEEKWGKPAFAIGAIREDLPSI
jgi:hypothetical protein